ncbi:hypothetical protein KUTeg_016137 [Tegillarca granosa]|uniref:Profilin n=1 Tax=Tegillarca granosa TaxID=220873 RepID=A0ABQ9EPR0_TEGGR|nr:hypothetical protein KUTeg_016137 [Tegillarca granosa]
MELQCVEQPVPMEISRLESISLKEDYLIKLWENYITDNIVESKPCEIGIFDWKSRRRIIASDHFRISKVELDQIADGVTYPDRIYRNGLTINGKNYNVQLADGKNGIFARIGTDGCTICKTFTYIIICLNDERVKSSKCNEDVMKLGDFLRRLGL